MMFTQTETSWFVVFELSGSAASLLLHTSQIFFFVLKPDYTSPAERILDDVMIRFLPDSRDGSSQTFYKTEPGTESSYSTVLFEY